MEPSKIFDKHVIGLFKAFNHLLQQREDRTSKAKLRNCSKRYNKDKYDFVKQFQEIFGDFKVDILTGRKSDEWLREEIIHLPYGKENVKPDAKFSLSKIYKSVSVDSDEQLAIQYHLYIIFREVTEDIEEQESLAKICQELETALGLDESSSEFESESESEGEETGLDSLFGDMSIENIGENAGNIVGTILESLGDMGIDMPGGAPPVDDIKNVISTITSNPKSKDAIKTIMSNVQQGKSIEGIIKDKDVQGLLKDTLSETAKMASESSGKFEGTGSVFREIALKESVDEPPLLISAVDEGSSMDPESQT